MCQSATCRTCGKTTWKGCGQHVDSVLRDVPRSQRCSCDEADRDPAPARGLLARILGG